MSMKAADLTNPEQGMDLTNRDPRGARKVADDIERVKNGTPTTEEELQALRERVEAARAIAPEGKDLHCRDCFERGRDAALRTVDGK